MLWAVGQARVLPAEPATTDDAVWEIESLEPGDFDYNLNEGRVVLNDRFRITFKEQGESAFVIADKGQLNQETGEVFAEGNVTLQSEDRVFTSDRLFYNFRTRSMQTDNFRAGRLRFLSRAPTSRVTRRKTSTPPRMSG